MPHQLDRQGQSEFVVGQVVTRCVPDHEFTLSLPENWCGPVPRERAGGAQ